MYRRVLLTALVLMMVAAPLMAAPRPGPWQVSFTLGSFSVRGEEARVEGDVLLANLGFLDFRIKDLNQAVFGGEWLISIGDWIEAGAGVSYYSGTAPSVYADLINADGSEIMQDLKLRIVPITASVRFLPLTRNAPVQPYVGAGVVFLPWRYSETGDFVDYEPDPPEIFRARYVQSGTNAGLVLLGGARVPLGSRYAIGGEVRYQKAEGKLGTDFYGDKIDLGGITYNFTFNVRF